MRKSALRLRDVIYGGEVRYWRNPAGRAFGENDAFKIETTWRRFESLESAAELAARKEQELAAETPFAWDPVFGYLSPIPVHCGTGLEIAGRFHLEGLHLTGDLEPALDGVEALRHYVDAVQADGLRDAAHIFTITTSAPLGLADRDLVARTRRIFDELARQELAARYRLVTELPRVLEDAISRALAILRHCRLLSKWELMDILSAVRLGCTLGFIDGITLAEADAYLTDQYLHGKVEPNPATVEEESARDRRDADLSDRINERFKDVRLNGRAESELS